MAWGIPDPWSNFLGDLFNPKSATAHNAKETLRGFPLLGTPAAWQLDQWGYGTPASGQNEPLTHPGIVSAPNMQAGIQGSTGLNFLDKLNREQGYQYYPAAQQQGGLPMPQFNTQLPSMSDALAQAKQLLSSSGWNPGYIDVNKISWDPLRKDANSRQSDYDAKIAAMYSQLQNAVRTKDAQAIKDNFGQAAASAQGSTDRTVQGLQDASQVADNHNADVLARLGLGDAAGRIIEQGRDMGSQNQQQVADALARGQVSQDAVSRQQQASGDYNTQMAGAYGLQGAETRDNLKSQLASLLAGYDMSEQQARAQAEQQNASLRQNEQNVLMSLANQVMGNQWNQVKYNDSLAQQQYQNALQQMQADQAQKKAAQDAAQRAADQQSSLNFFEQLMQQNDPKNYGGIGSLLNASMKPFMG